ncbi:MAG: hypothetical protein MK066_09215 [Crocinitomicaceae bacterium]|nr:hypothetical protein [Crocinitomicaceae bacterium]
MNYSIVHRKDLNVSEWDALVEKNQGAFFSYAWYLDAVAENWCVIVSEDYSQGIALPFTIRLKQEILYVPIFVSYLEWLGTSTDYTSINDLIHSRFKIIETAFKQAVLGLDFQTYVCQFIEPNEEVKISSQAKRMFKKADKLEYEITVNDSFEGVFDIIKSELNGKFTGLNDTSLSWLKQLFERSKERGTLKCFQLRKNNSLEGGIICFEDSNQILYVKGAVLDTSRKNGGMYQLIQSAKLEAKSSNKTFDFGGSRVEGVRRFNHNLGGKDREYFAYFCDNGPAWFRWLRLIKKRWFKK